jgi:hypothetical protein
MGELQRLKPARFSSFYVVGEPTTHKDFRIATQTLMDRPLRFAELASLIVLQAG